MRFRIQRRIKFKQQMADADCGAACLAMVLGYFGREVSVYQARLDCEAQGSATSMRAILAAARRHGLLANMVSVDLPGISQLACPAILHWNFNHFVVLERTGGDRFWVCDPALGRRVVHLDEFRKCFTGVCATFSPGATLARQKAEPVKAFRDYLRTTLYTRGAAGRISGVLALTLILQAISLLSPFLTIYIVDRLIPRGEQYLLGSVLAVIGVAAVSVASVGLLRARLIVKVQRLLDYLLLDGMLNHVIKLPAKFFLERSVANIQGRLNSSTVIRDAASTFTVSGVLDAVLAATYLIALLFIAPKFAALTIAVALFFVLIHVAAGSELRDRLTAELRTQTGYQGYVQELLTGILSIKASGAEDSVKKAWQRKLKNYLISSESRSNVDGAVTAATATVRLIGPAVLLWYSIVLYFSDGLSLGTVLALNAVSAMALVPLAGLVTLLRHVQLVKTHAERLSDIWLHDVEPSGGAQPPRLDEVGKFLNFLNVDFKYQAGGKQILSDITVEIPLGRRIGIVGPTGCGKSTVLGLILRFYEPERGQITVAGVASGEMNVEVYRGRLGYVPQVPFLFNNSIRKNLCLNRPDATLEEIDTVLQQVGLQDLVSSLPLKYDTYIGDNGVNLSGGQRQRLTIARALLQRPELMLLDEATSNLDAQTEERVLEALRRVQCTQVIVSHRLSAIRDCDLIYVMKNGQIEDSGSFEDLIQRNAFIQACAMSPHTADGPVAEAA